MSLRYIQRELPPPVPVPEPSEEFIAANAAHMRSMGIARLMDNGVDHADAVAFHALAGANVAWEAAGEWLGEKNMALARASAASGFERIAAAHFLHACACFRFGQSAFTFDTDEKKRLYRKVIGSFADAAARLEWTTEKVELSCRDGALCGWLFMPAVANPPVVIIFGGADGWRESYYTVGLPLLREGIAICLTDGPGQGESRLFRGLYITPGFAEDFALLVAHLKGHPALGGAVGVFGNSLGGTLAATVAAGVDDVAACCVNGGSIAPAEMADRFPRVLDKIGAMMGTEDRNAAQGLLEGMDLRGRAEAIRCPLLVLHGGADPLFAPESARAIHDEATSECKQMVVWEDGDHCVYNHAFERNSITAEWFATHLPRS